MSRSLDELLQVMARLRAADGCPWDREQTWASLVPYTIEEAYEVAAAVESGIAAELRDELGDLLLQVVFYAQIAREAGRFDFDAVAAGICGKLVRRHPHIFTADGAAPRSAQEQTRIWEDIKAGERRAGGGVPGTDASQLDGVPQALPALLRAGKLSRRAARVGFDFEFAAQAGDKVDEELAEVRAAAAANTGAEPSPAVFEEVGDLLFAAANFARKLGVEPEAALRAANAKFERRFRGMESLADGAGNPLENLDLTAQERLWQAVKRGE